MSFKSIVFVTMPTSGTGSMWRVITALVGDAARTDKVAERHDITGKLEQLGDWQPEPFDHVYMYNTPHIENRHLLDPCIRLIVNFRDPRDMACNQFHWAMQHPAHRKSEAELASYRQSVAERGIDHFVLQTENSLHLKEFRVLEDRLRSDPEDVLILSYSQLCLDFDGLVERLVAFLGVKESSYSQEAVERERTSNLAKNPQWIGQAWSGTDIMPGRYRKELTHDTITKLDRKYSDMIKFLRSLELPKFRSLLTTGDEHMSMDRVLFGKHNLLFLNTDSDDVLRQVRGKQTLSNSDLLQIAFEHRNRHIFGSVIGHFDYGHLIIPSKEVIFRESLPDTIIFEEVGPRPIRQFLESDGGKIWQPFYMPELLTVASDQKPFADTDSHWTHSGALRYFTGFLEARYPALAEAQRDIPMRRFSSKQQGDLAFKVEMPAEEVEIIAPQKASSKLVFTNGVVNEGCIRWFQNEDCLYHQKAFVIHDDFTSWLLGIIPELFKEVICFHGSIFDFDFVRSYSPSIVMCLQAERFFVRIPESGSMFDFVDAQERGKNGPSCFLDFWVKSSYGSNL